MPHALPIFQSFLCPREEFNTWSQPFGGPNTPWQADTRLIAGNFFAGLQGSVSVIFGVDTIPPGAIIQACDLVLTTEQTGNGGATTLQINTCTRGETVNLEDAPMETMYGFEGWRRGIWSAFEGDLRNAAFEILTQSPDPVVLPNRQAGLRFQDSTTPEPFADKAMRKLMGNRMLADTPTPGGGNILTQGFIVLSKQGAPATTGVFVDIYDADPTGPTAGNAIPGSVLATSDEIPIASITVQSQYPLVFSGVNQIPIVAGTTYFMVIRVSQPYTPDGTNFVLSHYQNAFLGQNRMRAFGVGMGVDWQNFPGSADVETMRGTAPLPDIPWDPPVNPIVGDLNVTTDITPLMQYQVDLPSYDNGGPTRRAVYFGIEGGGGAPNRIFASFRSLRAPPILRVTWLPPEPDDDKLADPAARYTGRHRIHEPWSNEYYRFKYGKEKPAAEELVAEIERPNVLAEMLDQATLDDYDARNAQNERDILELEAYISTVSTALAEEANTAMIALDEQADLIAQLEINVVLARETLIIALDSRRKHQNLLAAIEAVIRNYY